MGKRFEEPLYQRRHEGSKYTDKKYSEKPIEWVDEGMSE